METLRKMFQQHCFPIWACEQHLLPNQNVSEKVQQHFLFFRNKICFVACSHKWENIQGNNLFAQQCVLICRRLESEDGLLFHDRYTFYFCVLIPTRSYDQCHLLIRVFGEQSEKKISRLSFVNMVYNGIINGTFLLFSEEVMRTWVTNQKQGKAIMKIMKTM